MKKLSVALTAFSLLILLVFPFEASAQIAYPSPSWYYAPLTPRVGDSVTFNATDTLTYWTQSTITALEWDFADGTTASGAVVTHVFTQPGEYWVGLTATDNRGYGGTSQLLVIVAEQTPITLYSSLSSDVIYIGQNVIISGNLTSNGEGVPKETVSFSTKTFQDNAVWVDIGNTKTDESGLYSFTWQTQEPSGYQVRASWAGDSTYPQTSLSHMLYVVSYGDLITGFSSNSTISDLNFNVTTRLLSFRAEGSSGTRGYVNITLKDDSQFNPENLMVLMDNQPLSYALELTSPSWSLYFTYTHSSHNVLVDFMGTQQDSGLPPFEGTSDLLPIAVLFVSVIIAVVVLGLIFYLKKPSERRLVLCFNHDWLV